MARWGRAARQVRREESLLAVVASPEPSGQGGRPSIGGSCQFSCCVAPRREQP